LRRLKKERRHAFEKEGRKGRSIEFQGDDKVAGMAGKIQLISRHCEGKTAANQRRKKEVRNRVIKPKRFRKGIYVIGKNFPSNPSKKKNGLPGKRGKEKYRWGKATKKVTLKKKEFQ